LHLAIECVFLGYSVEYKGYRCWDLIAGRMHTSRDVVFDESRPFYPHPSSDASPASLVDPFSFLLFPDAPSAPLPISLLTLTSLVPSFVSSCESSPMVLDYIVKPLVAQVYSTIV
jgi:hypothetical protein